MWCIWWLNVLLCFLSCSAIGLCVFSVVNLMRKFIREREKEQKRATIIVRDNTWYLREIKSTFYNGNLQIIRLFADHCHFYYLRNSKARTHMIYDSNILSEPSSFSPSQNALGISMVFGPHWDFNYHIFCVLTLHRESIFSKVDDPQTGQVCNDTHM